MLTRSGVIVSLPTSFILFLGFVALPRATAVTLGQIDTFQDGTTDSWFNGGVQPVNISSGGPLGANDRFLELTADGGGANGRLTVLNRNQWLGNYIASGVNEIDLDLNNFSNVVLSIRLAFKSGTFNGAPGYVTTTAFSLGPNSGWQQAVFSITPATMTAVGSVSPFVTFFTAPSEFRVINAATVGDLNGDNVIGQLGIDNIAAVPEPSSIMLLGLAGIGIVFRRSTRQ
jgi:PEP-CTERM motif